MRKNLLAGSSQAKLSTGPTLPMPGPTLPRLVAVAPMAVSRSWPRVVITMAPNTKMVTYSRKKPRMLKVTLSFMAEPLIRTGNMARGCRMRFSSNTPFLITTAKRITFTPPLVLPELPPTKSSTKKSVVRKGVQAV